MCRGGGLQTETTEVERRGDVGQGCIRANAEPSGRDQSLWGTKRHRPTLTGARPGLRTGCGWCRREGAGWESELQFYYLCC